MVAAASVECMQPAENVGHDNRLGSAQFEIKRLVFCDISLGLGRRIRLVSPFVPIAKGWTPLRQGAGMTFLAFLSKTIVNPIPRRLWT